MCSSFVFFIFFFFQVVFFFSFFRFCPFRYPLLTGSPMIPKSLGEAKEAKPSCRVDRVIPGGREEQRERYSKGPRVSGP